MSASIQKREDFTIVRTGKNIIVHFEKSTCKTTDKIKIERNMPIIKQEL